MAEEASRLKDEFLAVLSHELRTPLNTVLGYARMLRREDARMTGELRERALDALERNADALSRLVGDVLDTSRIVTGKLRLRLEPCRSTRRHRAARSIPCVRRRRPRAWRSSVDASPALLVLADRDRLQQVLWNLLSNAIKFTPAGGGVRARAARHGSVAIAVQRHGHRDRARAPAVRVPAVLAGHTGASREFGGLGIGLALARQLVEMHGGTIAADSPGAGAGATFTILLPSPAAGPARERNLRPVAK